MVDSHHKKGGNQAAEDEEEWDSDLYEDSELDSSYLESADSKLESGYFNLDSYS